jgi:hypothetical protein
MYINWDLCAYIGVVACGWGRSQFRFPEVRVELSILRFILWQKTPVAPNQHAVSGIVVVALDVAPMARSATMMDKTTHQSNPGVIAGPEQQHAP